MKNSVLCIGVVMLALGFAVAGCGSSGSGATTTTAAPTTTTVSTTTSTTNTTIPPGTPGSITGTVKFATTSDGVKGNTYISYTGPASGSTMANTVTGVYGIAGLSDGTYSLTVTKEGWTTSTETVVLSTSAIQHLSITPANWEVHFIGSTNLNRMSLLSNGNRRNYLIVGDNGTAYGLSVTAASPLGIDWSLAQQIVTHSTTDKYMIAVSPNPYTNKFVVFTGSGLGYDVTPEAWNDWASDPSTSDLGLTNITSSIQSGTYNAATFVCLVAAGSLNYANPLAHPIVWHTIGGGSGLSLRDQSRFGDGDCKIYLCGADGKLARTVASTESDPAANSLIEIAGFPSSEQLNGILVSGAGGYGIIVTEQGNIYVTTTPGTGSSWTTDPSLSASGTFGLSGIPYALKAVVNTDFGTYVVGDNGLLMIHN